MGSHIRHQARNWLHHIVLAAIVAEADTVAKNFAHEHPLGVEDVTGGRRWTSWEEWRAFLERALGPLRPAELSLHVAGQPHIEPDAAEEAEELHIRWEMSYDFRGRDVEPVTLACEATLVQEAGRWVASRLAWTTLTSA